MTPPTLQTTGGKDPYTYNTIQTTQYDMSPHTLQTTQYDILTKQSITPSN